ncbi:MAG: hypothetical protein C0402_00340 [Thermodesulfovibrio sp.]|nr:hypothetical protein [Thermodesulfovibrio sp.]
MSSVALFFFIFVTLTVTFAATDSAVRSRRNQTSPAHSLQVRLADDTSLHQLIQKAGYSLADKDVAVFLAEFSTLNEGLKSISSIKKGTVVRLPLSHLAKDTTAPARPQKSRRPATQKKKAPDPVEIPRRNTEPVMLPEHSSARRPQTIQAIRRLVEELYGVVVMEQAGLKYFSVGQRSEISFDTTSFPLMVLSNGVVLVLDPSAALPAEIRQMIRMVWPEYVFASYREGQDLRTVIDNLLVSLGYTVSRDRTLVAGGHSQIEYHADFVIFRKEDELLEGDLTAVTFISPQDRELPESLVQWFRARDIRLIQLATAEKGSAGRAKAEVAELRGLTDSRAFVESIITRLGYIPSRDVVLSLSDRKDFTYKLRADISFASGPRTKVVEFADLSEQEIAFARKRGIDIICIDVREDDQAVLKKLIDLLGVAHIDTPESSAAYITPRNAKYRLALQGVYLKTQKGTFFITDSELETELLRDIVDPGLKVITY